MAACALAMLSLLAPAYAQDKVEAKQQGVQKAAQKGQTTLEVGGEAPWYNVRGPRINFDYNSKAGRFSGAYVPLSETNKSAQDLHLIWQLPKRWTGTDFSVRAIFENSDTKGIGGGVGIEKGISNSTSITGRVEGFENGTVYGEIKLLNKNLDLDFGLMRENGKTHPYGYFSINGGKWDDTFTLGVGPDKTVWNNFSAHREKWGTFSLNYYNPLASNWTIDVYIARSDVSTFWYERFIDRLVASNDINPKERSYILALPSYLTFGRWCGELRADRTGKDSFVNAGFGRTFTLGSGTLKGARFGIGAGVEYARKPGDVLWLPNGELFLELPFGRSGEYSVTAVKRFREREGSYYFSLARRF